MFYVLIEIANFSQLQRLNAQILHDIRQQMLHLGQNRGGRLAKEQNGQFLFEFHPTREKALSLALDFMVMVRDSLAKKQADLYGYTILFEAVEGDDLGLVLQKLRGLLLLSGQDNRILAGPAAAAQFSTLLDLKVEDGIAEIIGTQVGTDTRQMDFQTLMALTGWTEALEKPIENLLANPQTSGRILRVRGPFVEEKWHHLQEALATLTSSTLTASRLIPPSNSRDFLTQLLGLIQKDFVPTLLSYLGPGDRQRWQSQPQLETLLLSGGDSLYSGDCAQDDVARALELYFTALVGQMKDLGQAPILTLVEPLRLEKLGRDILEAIFGRLINQFGMNLILLEEPLPATEFLGHQSSITWSFPSLLWSKLDREIQGLGLALPTDQTGEALVRSVADRGAGLAHYFMALNDPQIGIFQPEEGADYSWQYLNAFDITHRKIYYIFLVGLELLSEERLVRFFTYLGEDPAIIKDKVKHLIDWGYLSFGQRNLALRPDFRGPIEAQLKHEGAQLLAKLADWLFVQWQKDHHLSEVVTQILIEAGKPDLAIPVLTHYITLKINRGQGDFLPLLRPKNWERFAANHDLAGKLALLSAAFKLRFALNYSSRAWVEEDLIKFRKNVPSGTPETSLGEWLLQSGRFLMAIGKPGEAFPYLKKAQILAQEARDQLLEVRSGTEIGLALLVRRRIDEAREYFEMAAKMAERQNWDYNLCTNQGFTIIAQFLWGNLSECRALLTAHSPRVEKAGIHRWKVLFEYLRGRLEFETGQYAKAEMIFGQAQSLAEDHHLSSALVVLNNWKARSMAYQQRWLQALDLLNSTPDGPESRFFRAEAHYHGKQYAKALEVLKNLEDEPTTLRRYSGEAINWLSGFDLIEDRLLAVNEQRGVLENLVSGFRLYLENLVGNPGPWPEGFQRLLSQKALLDVDPNCHLYYYWYYQIIPAEALDSEALRSTILGRAFKALQTRASRIGDRADRVAFLAEPYWNGQLLEEARKLKLL